MVNRILKDYGLSLDEEVERRIEEYLNMILKAPMNLTGVSSLKELIHKSVAEVLYPLNEKLSGTLIDVGTGAGIPGMILAFTQDLKVTLLDSKHKKIKFLEEVVKRLSLENVRLICERAEVLGKMERETYDYATSRAVAKLNVLLELTVPFIKVGGKLLLYKGPRYVEELFESERAAEVLGVDLERTVSYELLTGEKRVLLVFKKVKETPQRYPRKPGIPQKRPLR